MPFSWYAPVTTATLPWRWTFKSESSATFTWTEASAVCVMYPLLLYVVPSSTVMTKSSASSDARMSIFRCLYESVHFVSSARTFAASSSCAAMKGTVPSARNNPTIKTASDENEMRIRCLPCERSILQRGGESQSQNRFAGTRVISRDICGKNRSAQRLCTERFLGNCAHSLKDQRCLMKAPACNSAIAWRSCSCVFITIGPYHATGSSIGLPETNRNRMPSSPACTTISSPRSKSTSEWLLTSYFGG